MQLIFDTETDICIDKKMALIDKETVNEKFTTDNIIEKFSNDVSNGNKENIVKVENIVVDNCKESDDLNSLEVNGQDKLHLEDKNTQNADTAASHSLECNLLEGLDSTESIAENIKPLEKPHESLVNKTNIEVAAQAATDLNTENLDQDIDLKQNVSSNDSKSELNADESNCTEIKQEEILLNNESLKNIESQNNDKTDNLNSCNNVDCSVKNSLEYNPQVDEILEQSNNQNTIESHEDSNEVPIETSEDMDVDESVLIQSNNNCENKTEVSSTSNDMMEVEMEQCSNNVDIMKSSKLHTNDNIIDKEKLSPKPDDIQAEEKELDKSCGKALEEDVTESSMKDLTELETNNLILSSETTNAKLEIDILKEVENELPASLKDVQGSEETNNQNENKLDAVCSVVPSSPVYEAEKAEDEKPILENIQDSEKPVTNKSENQLDNVCGVSSSLVFKAETTEEEKSRLRDTQDSEEQPKLKNLNQLGDECSIPNSSVLIAEKIDEEKSRLKDTRDAEEPAKNKNENQLNDNICSVVSSRPGVQAEKKKHRLEHIEDSKDLPNGKNENQSDDACSGVPSSPVFEAEKGEVQEPELEDIQGSESAKNKTENQLNDVCSVGPSHPVIKTEKAKKENPRLNDTQSEEPANNLQEHQSDDACSVDSSPSFEDDKTEKLSSKVETETKSEIQLKNKNDPIKLSKKSKLTLDILSDDEDTDPSGENKNKDFIESNKQCINIEDDDDDIMLIDDDSSTKTDGKMDITTINNETHKDKSIAQKDEAILEDKVEEPLENTSANLKDTQNNEKPSDIEKINCDIPENEVKERKTQSPKPLLPKNFVSTCKKNLAEMTRSDLEEFCILKIVESVVDRGNLGEIKSQLKKMAQNIDEYKNKAKMLTKQNHALQVVLKSVQEELKKNSNGPITPLKISRSVGIQVLMSDKIKKKPTNSNVNIPNNVANSTPVNKTIRGAPPPVNRSLKQSPQNIPVPRLVPASSGIKNNTSLPNQTPTTNTKPTNTPSPASKKTSTILRPEKRPLPKSQNADTVDLTDDEPPPKVVSRSPNTQTVRLVPPQNLMAPQRPQLGTIINSPRKVYIPISGGQGQNVRPGQTFMLRPINTHNVRHRNPAPKDTPFRRSSLSLHPAPLPDCTKQCQPPNWKAIPPSPEIKLSKVENGIVISWKLDNFHEDSHETIASYQIYAYQETASTPSTSLWKKIGDVKALPLPMACTLTQFVSGYKYYFAVRAVDIRSRLGPFSSPSNIMLLNK